MIEIKLAGQIVVVDNSVCKKVDTGIVDTVTVIEHDPLRGCVVTLQNLGKITYRHLAKHWDKVV